MSFSGRRRSCCSRGNGCSIGVVTTIGACAVPGSRCTRGKRCSGRGGGLFDRACVVVLMTGEGSATREGLLAVCKGTLIGPFP